MQKLADKLIQNDEIILKMREISDFEDSLNNYISNNIELRLTVFEYRKKINNFILEKIKDFEIPQKLKELLMEHFWQKLDLIFTPSIGEYRLKEWYDNRFAVDMFIEHLDIERNKQLIALIFLKSINKSSINEVIKKNEDILIKKPLTKNEIINLNKRIIYAMFGGIENIENIELAKYKFNSDYTSYNYEGSDAIERCYLKINIKDQNKISKIKYLKEDWDKQLREYYDYLQDGILANQLDIISSIEYEKLKCEFFKAESLANNHLLVINYSKQRDDYIKMVVNDWKPLEKLNFLKQSTDYIINNIWQKVINPMIEKSKQIILQFVEMCFRFYNLKKDLRFQIISIINKLDEKNEFSEIDELRYNQLFDILYSYATNKNR